MKFLNFIDYLFLVYKAFTSDDVSAEVYILNWSIPPVQEFFNQLSAPAATCAVVNSWGPAPIYNPVIWLGSKLTLPWPVHSETKACATPSLYKVIFEVFAS